MNKDKNNTYNQLQCSKCKFGLIPIYNKENKTFKLYCDNCKQAWTIQVDIGLADGISLYEGEW